MREIYRKRYESNVEKKNYEHKICSSVMNPDFDKQYVLYGLKH